MERKVRRHAIGELARGEGLADAPCIYNRAYLADVPGSDISDILQSGRLHQMANVEKLLNARKDLNDAEKHRAAEYLSSAPGAAVLSAYEDACRHFKDHEKSAVALRAQEVAANSSSQ